MTATLRPMNLGEILDRTFQIYRSRFLVFVGIAALPAVVIFALHLSDGWWMQAHMDVPPFRQRGSASWRFLLWLVFYHVSSFFGAFILPAFATQVTANLRGEACSTRASLRFVIARWRSYLWVTVLKIGAVLLIPESIALGALYGVFAIAKAAGALNTMKPSLAFALVMTPFLVGVGVFGWLGACFAFCLPAAAMEQLKGFAVLRRSWQVSKEGRARVFTAWLLIAVIGWSVSLGAQGIFRFFIMLLYRQHYFVMLLQQSYLPLIYLLYAVLSTLIGPIYPIALTLIYYDQRIRREGYDIEWMMSAAGLNAPGTLPAGAVEETPVTALAHAAVGLASSEGPTA